MSAMGGGDDSSGHSSSRSEIAMVPLVDDMTMRLTPATAAAWHTTRVPSTWTWNIRCASSGLRETKPAKW